MPNFFCIFLNPQNNLYEAVNGPNANKTFTAADGADANGLACLTNDKNGKYVAFATAGPNKASHLTNFETANTNILYTADVAGLAGNNIRIRYVVAGNNTPLSVSVSTNDITVNLATNGSGVPTSTAEQVRAAVVASGPANALVDVAHEAGSSGAGVIPSSFTFTNLAYGSDGSAVATIVEQVESTTFTPTTF